MCVAQATNSIIQNVPTTIKIFNNKLCISLEPDCVEKFCLNKQNLAYGYMTKKQFDLEYSIIKKSLALGKGEIFSVKGKNGIGAYKILLILIFMPSLGI